jgi:hypothetical protein
MRSAGPVKQGGVPPFSQGQPAARYPSHLTSAPNAIHIPVRWKGGLAAVRTVKGNAGAGTAIGSDAKVTVRNSVKICHYDHSRRSQEGEGEEGPADGPLFAQGRFLLAPFNRIRSADSDLSAGPEVRSRPPFWLSGSRELRSFGGGMDLYRCFYGGRGYWLSVGCAKTTP